MFPSKDDSNRKGKEKFPFCAVNRIVALSAADVHADCHPRKGKKRWIVETKRTKEERGECRREPNREYKSRQETGKKKKKGAPTEDYFPFVFTSEAI